MQVWPTGSHKRRARPVLLQPRCRDPIPVFYVPMGHFLDQGHHRFAKPGRVIRLTRQHHQLSHWRRVRDRVRDELLPGELLGHQHLWRDRDGQSRLQGPDGGGNARCGSEPRRRSAAARLPATARGNRPHLLVREGAGVRRQRGERVIPQGLGPARQGGGIAQRGHASPCRSATSRVRRDKRGCESIVLRGDILFGKDLGPRWRTRVARSLFGKNDRVDRASAVRLDLLA